MCIIIFNSQKFNNMISDILVVLFYVLVFIVLWLLMKVSKTDSSKANKLPPGPSRLPLIGNLHQLKNPLHKSLQKLANKHGDIMMLQLGSVPTLVVSSPDVVQEIFKFHDLVFSDRPVLYAAKRLTYNCSNISFAPCNENWRELRKIAMLELLSVKRVQSFRRVREEEVDLMLNKIELVSGVVNLSRLTLELTNNFLCRVAFGKKFDSIYSTTGIRPRDLLREAQDLLAGICLADFFPGLGWVNKLTGLDSRLEKNFNELDRLFDMIIKEHVDRIKSKPEHEDLVDVLLRVQKESCQGITLSDNSIKGVIVDVFIAGTDTAAATLTWTMTELIRNPVEMKKVQEEVRKVAKGKQSVSESDLTNLTYLKLVIKESLRLHPPAPALVPRETTEPCTINDYYIPAKTRVFINAKALSTAPKLWDKANEFKPERFVNSSVDFKGQHYEFIPFGAGRRGCPGMHFALTFIEIALANLLLRFDWELPDGMRREDVDVEEASGITVHKKNPLSLIAAPWFRR